VSNSNLFCILQRTASYYSVWQFNKLEQQWMFRLLPPCRYVLCKMLDKQRYGTFYTVLYIVTITDHFSFYINIISCVDNEIYWIFYSSLKTRLNKTLKIYSIFHTLLVYNKFNPIQIFTRTGVETLLSCTALIAI
jgi:hypothetical protein